MSKDAFYFPHDSNAKDDPKIVMLMEQLGLEGYGIYWVLIEILRDQPDHKYPFVLLGALARRFNTTKDKMEIVVRGYKLFDIDENEFFLSPSLCRRMAIVNERRLRLQEAGRKGRQKQLGPPLGQAQATPGRVKESKGKESKVKETKKAPEKFNHKLFKPPCVSEDLWNQFIENRKFKKLQNTKLGLKVIMDSFGNGLGTYTYTEMITRYVTTGMQRFNPSWMGDGEKQLNGQGQTSLKPYSVRDAITIQNNEIARVLNEQRDIENGTIDVTNSEEGRLFLEH